MTNDNEVSLQWKKLIWMNTKISYHPIVVKKVQYHDTHNNLGTWPVYVAKEWYDRGRRCVEYDDGAWNILYSSKVGMKKFFAHKKEKEW